MCRLREHSEITFTKPFAARASPRLLYHFQRRLYTLLKYFPEIRGEIRIGLTNSYMGLASTESDGNRVTARKLSFPPLNKNGTPSSYIIGHELMHLVQEKRKKTIPGTERATDVYTLARLPPRYIDHLPVYLKTPRKLSRHWSNERVRNLASIMMHELAIEAIIIRKTNPRYISWWENQFVDYVENGYPIAKYLNIL